MSYLHMSPNPPDDFVAFTKVNAQLLNAPTPLKHIPLRIYIPSSPPDAGGAPGSFKVMQTLVAPRIANRECFSSLRTVSARRLSPPQQIWNA